MAEKDERKKKKRRSPMIAGSLVALAAAVVLLFRQCGIELPFEDTLNLSPRRISSRLVKIRATPPRAGRGGSSGWRARRIPYRSA